MTMQDIRGDVHIRVGNIPTTTDGASKAVVFTTPYKMDLQEVYAVADTALTGQATNYTSLNVYKNGTTTKLGGKNFNASTVTMAQWAKESIYKPTTADALAANDRLVILFEKTGTGLSNPGSDVFIVIRNGALV